MYDAADADADTPHPVRTADRAPRRHGPRAVAVAAAVGALLAIAGCGGGGGDGKADAKAEAGGNAARPSASASPTPKAARVEQLASAAGCKPEFTTKVDDYRQAVCKNSRGKFLFLDFATAKNQRDWLETAQMYGGVYLVGNRWVLSSSPRKNMEEFREKFGGTIEEGTSYGGASRTPR
ncbi:MULTISPECIES: hypothetical protein [Streptomyces violaceusniger group]|uniref:Lipoprotein n=2 Tax=Streptomyces rhizosphaericus TaxID=114699 RepID=A0ABN1NVL0_9ACTN|nr:MULTISPECIES: hypothetical protein [Streptomyces violaceusniger group]